MTIFFLSASFCVGRRQSKAKMLRADWPVATTIQKAASMWCGRGPKMTMHFSSYVQRLFSFFTLRREFWARVFYSVVFWLLLHDRLLLKMRLGIDRRLSSTADLFREKVQINAEWVRKKPFVRWRRSRFPRWPRWRHDFPNDFFPLSLTHSIQVREGEMAFSGKSESETNLIRRYSESSKSKPHVTELNESLFVANTFIFFLLLRSNSSDEAELFRVSQRQTIWRKEQNKKLQ